MADEWVAIPETLMSAALREMDPLPPSNPLALPGPARAAAKVAGALRPHATTDVPPSLLSAIIEYLSEDLGCDHSVNICTCEAAGIVQELELALEGKLTCRKCGGDGFTWDREVYDREVKRIAVREGISVDEVRGIYDDAPGYVNCPTCGGQGITRIEDVA